MHALSRAIGLAVHELDPTAEPADVAIFTERARIALRLDPYMMSASVMFAQVRSPLTLHSFHQALSLGRRTTCPTAPHPNPSSAHRSAATPSSSSLTHFLSCPRYPSSSSSSLTRCTGMPLSPRASV
eukprot:scaffold159519_cov39-Tisochrysis_lutea.AAC.1